jgi:hypothetical protein
MIRGGGMAVDLVYVSHHRGDPEGTVRVETRRIDAAEAEVLMAQIISSMIVDGMRLSRYYLLVALQSSSRL